ncbi:11170_t:CDS:2, partial [Acaulospora colombiana]
REPTCINVQVEDGASAEMSLQYTHQSVYLAVEGQGHKEHLCPSNEDRKLCMGREDVAPVSTDRGDLFWQENVLGSTQFEDVCQDIIDYPPAATSDLGGKSQLEMIVKISTIDISIEYTASRLKRGDGYSSGIRNKGEGSVALTKEPLNGLSTTRKGRFTVVAAGYRCEMGVLGEEVVGERWRDPEGEGSSRIDG